MGLIGTRRRVAKDGDTPREEDAPREEDRGPDRLEEVAAAEREAQELLERRREELRQAERAGSQRIAELERELEDARRRMDEQGRALAKARATAGGERERREDLESELAATRLAAEQELAEERSRSAGLQTRVTELEQRLERTHAEREKAKRQKAERQKAERQAPPPVKGRATRPEVDVQKAGGCAVCQHSPDEDDLDKLREAGWIAHSGTLLCPKCQADGWRFPADATFPLRRYSDRSRSDEPAGDRPPGQPDSRSALATAASDASTSARARPKAGPSPLRAARDRRR